MSLLGVDVGTTATKAVVFSSDGIPKSVNSVEYEISRPRPGWAELNAEEIWPRIRDAIRRAVNDAGQSDPVSALAVGSMGENLVPVSKDRRVLGPSIMNMDERGGEFMDRISAALKVEELYDITGNTLTNQFSIGKLMWMQANQPDLYENVDYFLPWNSFVSFMLGAEPVAEYALASRTLLFDVGKESWSERMIEVSGLDPGKLPPMVAAGKAIGAVGRDAAEATGLRTGTPIIIGTHDQAAASIGSGALGNGVAMYGMGTFHCIAPVFDGRKAAAGMIGLGLNTEHYALSGTYFSLIYNSGGAAVKWFRDTFAASECRAALQSGEDIYPSLFAEVPETPTPVQVIPHFGAMGPPDYVDPPNAAFVGMTLATGRGDILKGIMEGNVFSLKMTVDALHSVGIVVDAFHATGGGSRSDAMLQLCVDIMGRPCMRPAVTEASALGSAVLAGAGSRAFAGLTDGIAAMLRPGEWFEADAARHELYVEKFAEYLELRKFVVGPPNPASLP